MTYARSLKLTAQRWRHIPNCVPRAKHSLSWKTCIRL